MAIATMLAVFDFFCGAGAGVISLITSIELNAKISLPWGISTIKNAIQRVVW